MVVLIVQLMSNKVLLFSPEDLTVSKKNERQTLKKMKQKKSLYDKTFELAFNIHSRHN